ncbi:MAG TPA: hypothetical protein P5121_31655 [Caldilineaceae bacterium]|nr:hypothetical protein [Caldilineaceae bacterium]
MLDRGWRWFTPLNHQLEPWPPHMRIALPRHQAHAHQLRENGENDFIDFLFTDFAGDIWRAIGGNLQLCRRSSAPSSQPTMACAIWPRNSFCSSKAATPVPP